MRGSASLMGEARRECLGKPRAKQRGAQGGLRVGVGGLDITKANQAHSSASDHSLYGKVTLKLDCLKRGTRARLTALSMHEPTGVPLNGPELTLAPVARPVFPLKVTSTVAVPPASALQDLTAPLTP